MDAFRYFFLREGSFGQDWDFTDGAMVKRYNSDLANDLGNLVSRAITMAARFGDGKVPVKPASLDASNQGLEARFQSGKMGYEDCGAALLESVFERYEALDYAGALSLVWSWIGQLNQRIVAEAPWEAVKDPERRTEIHQFLYRLLEAIRLIAVLLLAGDAARLASHLRDARVARHRPHARRAALGRPPDRASVRSHPVPVPPHRRDGGRAADPSQHPDVAAAAAAQGEDRVRTHEARRSARRGRTGRPDAPPPVETTQAAPPAGPKIDIDDFAKIELRAARVVAAEKIAGSRKLLKLQVDLGDEQRQIVSGISDAYEPEALIGKKIVLVANLKPAKLMGVESNGMVLAASVDGRAVLCTFDSDVAPGTKVK